MYAVDAYTKSKSQFEKELPEILQALNVSEKEVVDLRIARWGHALPLQVFLWAKITGQTPVLK